MGRDQPFLFPISQRTNVDTPINIMVMIFSLNFLVFHTSQICIQTIRNLVYIFHKVCLSENQGRKGNS